MFIIKKFFKTFQQLLLHFLATKVDMFLEQISQTKQIFTSNKQIDLPTLERKECSLKTMFSVPGKHNFSIIVLYLLCDKLFKWKL